MSAGAGDLNRPLTPRLDASQLARVTCLVQTTLALAYSWRTEAETAAGSDQPHHGLSAGVIASALLFMAGQWHLLERRGTHCPHLMMSGISSLKHLTIILACIFVLGTIVYHVECL